MKSISIKKVIRDLVEEKSRTIIVLIAMVLGTFSVAMLTTSNQILNQNLRSNYLQTNPASFTIVVNDSTEKAVNLLKSIQEIKNFEIRSKIAARFKTFDNQWLPMWLFVVEDFNSVTINSFKIDVGTMPVNTNEMVIERAFRKMTVIEPNNLYQIKLAGKEPITMKVSGKIHDAGQAPSWMENMLYGYIDSKTAKALNIYTIQKEIKCVIVENRYDKQTIENVLIKTKKLLLENNIDIVRSEILPPGEHPHESQMKSLMFLLQMFGVLVLFLSCFLIINMISSIMNKQIRQIGIMKSIGASNNKIIRIYITFVLILALIANIVAIPLGYHVGLLYSNFVAGMLNFNIFYTQLPLTDLVFLISIGLSLPILVSLYPVIKTSRTTVQKSLNDYGVEEKNKSSKLMTLFPFSNIMQYSIRNTFRQKIRLLITSVVLVLGGAIFISSFNIRSSSNNTVTEMFDNVKYDFQIFCNQNYSASTLDSCIKALPNVKQYEYEHSSKFTVPFSNGLESEQFVLRTIAGQSLFFKLDIMKGTNLQANKSGIVINHTFAAKFNNLDIDSVLKIKWNNQIIETKIIGISRDLFSQPTIYFDKEYFTTSVQLKNVANMILIDVDNENIGDFSEYSTSLEQTLAKNKINVNLLYRKDTYKKAVVEHLVVIMTMLIMMTFLLLLVGGLGLATTMSINVVERKRELGILRAIGVTDTKMYKLLLFEGVTIAMISWFFATILSMPLSYFLGNKFFTIFFETTLNFAVSPTGILFWLLISVIFSFLAVMFPTRNISKMNAGELIAYE